MNTRRRFLQTATAAALPVLPLRAARGAGADFQPTLFELRSYLCEPGNREALIEMFETTFLDAYQAGGTRVVATFRHLDEADRWVWMRAFRTPAERGAALAAFYGSAAWKARADAANATIRDISPALLLQETGTKALAHLEAAPSAKVGGVPACVYRVEVFPLVEKSEAAFPAWFERVARPSLAALGAAPRATLVSDRSENSFPRQPVRSEPGFVTITRFSDAAALAAFEAARATSAAWRERVEPALREFLAGPIEVHRLQPTTRSALR